MYVSQTLLYRSPPLQGGVRLKRGIACGVPIPPGRHPLRAFRVIGGASPLGSGDVPRGSDRGLSSVPSITPSVGKDRGRRVGRADLGSGGSGDQKAAGTAARSLSPGRQVQAGGLSDRIQVSDVVDYFINLPWQKMASWGLVLALASQLKEFLGITMGTFIVSFIGNSFVASFQRLPQLERMSPQKRRRVLVIVYYTGILLLLTLFGVLIIPDVVREGYDFVSRLQTENLWTVVLEKMRKGLGDGMMDHLERFLVFASSGDAVNSVDFQKLESMTKEARTTYLGGALQKVLQQYTNAAAYFISDMLSFISRFAVQLGISFVLSFMMVWDLPHIATAVQSLRSSRVAPVYNTVAPSVKVFATLFGKALQAQSRIALCNTVLTALGMWALAIPGVGLLSVFVFVCGFIPIAGVIMSTIPIGFVAVTEYGFTKLGLVLLMVTGVHFVEAYGLNPAIYSAHLKLHPLLVLTALVVAEHSFGVWGLLLAVPLSVFTLDYCIYYPSFSAADVAQKELESVTPRSLTDGEPRDSV